MAEGSEGEKNRTMKRLPLIINCLLLAVGTSGGPLVMRLYFLRGGKRVWLSSFLETAGFPFMLLPLAVSYFRRRAAAAAAGTAKPSPVSMKPALFAASVFIGVLTGLDDYLYAYGVARLPVSTSALIIATQLGFTAFFAFLLVRQKFTSYSVNAVVLLTIGAGILALHASGDRPPGESMKAYVMGFVTTVIAAALYGLVLPMVELVYKKTKQPITYSLVMEIQLVMCFSASVFCFIGMIINNDLKVIPREAKTFKHGEVNYYVVLVGSAILWQAFFLGAIGVIFCASSLFSGILIAVLLPITEVLAVIFYKEKFQAEKGVSLLLSLWGMVSYFYGEIKHEKKMKKKKSSDIEATMMPELGIIERRGNIATEVRFWFWHCREVNQIFFATVIFHLITMSRSGQPPDLKKYMDKKLQIKLNANRMIVGTLRGFDQFMNLVVDNTVEVNGNEKTDIGMVVIRGNSVVTVEALEPVNRT